MRSVIVSVYEPEPEPRPSWPVITEPDPLYADWTDEQVTAEWTRLNTEYTRRRAVAEAQAESIRALVAHQAARGIGDGTAWMEPVTFMDTVPPGGTRVFEGDLYRAVAEAPVGESPAVAPDLWELVAEGVDPEPIDPAPEPEPDPGAV